MWSSAQNMCTPASAPLPRPLSSGRRGSFGVGPERVVVPEAVGVVPDAVPGGLLVPGGPPGVRPVQADLLAELLDALGGQPAELLRLTGTRRSVALGACGRHLRSSSSNKSLHVFSIYPSVRRD